MPFLSPNQQRQNTEGKYLWRLPEHNLYRPDANAGVTDMGPCFLQMQGLWPLLLLFVNFCCLVTPYVELSKNEKALVETQTLRDGCSKAEPKKFAPPQTPFSGGAGRPKFNQLEIWSLPLPTNPVWWGSMHAISSYRGNRPRQTNTHKPPYRTDYDTLRRRLWNTAWGHCICAVSTGVSTKTEDPFVSAILSRHYNLHAVVLDVLL